VVTVAAGCCASDQSGLTAIIFLPCCVWSCVLVLSAERVEQSQANRAAIAALRQQCDVWDAQEVDTMKSIVDRQQDDQARRRARIDELQQTQHELHHLQELSLEEAVQRADEFVDCGARVQKQEVNFRDTSTQPLVPLVAIHPAVTILSNLRHGL
jgi:hypothetical protein